MIIGEFDVKYFEISQPSLIIDKRIAKLDWKYFEIISQEANRNGQPK